jgi:hypothetical protein
MFTRKFSEVGEELILSVPRDFRGRRKCGKMGDVGRFVRLFAFLSQEGLFAA